MLRASRWTRFLGGVDVVARYPPIRVLRSGRFGTREGVPGSRSAADVALDMADSEAAPLSDEALRGIVGYPCPGDE